MPQAKKVTKKTPAKAVTEPVPPPEAEPEDPPELLDPGQPAPEPIPDPPAAPLARKAPMAAVAKPKKAKAGANFYDRNQIAKLAATGLDVEQISLRLNIKDEVVRAFMPKADSVDTLTE